MSDELPEGWARIPLVEAVALLQNGPFGSLLHRSDYVSGGVPLINPANIVQGRLVADPDITVGRGIIKRLASYVMRPSDVVVGRRGEMGRAALVTDERDEWFCGTGCAFIRPGEAIDAGYLASWFGSPEVRANLEHVAVGATMKNLSTKILGGVEFSLPPLPEQHRIVERVEALLAEVNKATDRLDRVKEILKRFRQSVLAAACSGKLTEAWRSENSGDTTAVGVGESVEDDLLTELPSEWTTVRLESLVLDSFYGPRFSSEQYTETGGVPTVRTSDMDFRGRIKLGDAPRVKVTPTEMKKFGLVDGDLLVTRTGATIGKCCLYTADLGPAIPSAYLIRFRLRTAMVLPEFGLLFLQSQLGQRLLGIGQTAVAQPNVNARTIRAFPFPLPPIKEQGEIMRAVGSLLAVADVVEARVTAATSRADKVPQAILSKAFRGELVPTEAEFARAEGREFESAEEMLERVREANEKAAPTRSRRTVARRKK